MKARLVHENLNFERGLETRKALGIGSYQIPSAQELIGHKGWADQDSIERYQRTIDHAMDDDSSNEYRKYIQFVVENGHLTSSSSSVFNAWVKENIEDMTIEGIRKALDDLWPRNTDENSKSTIIHHAKRSGIK